MDYAVQLQKISLGDDRWIFNTIGLIRGKYIEETNSFIDEFGFEYFLIENSMYADRCFCYYTNMDELKKDYGQDLSEQEILENYLDEHMGLFYLGYYDFIEYVIKAVEVNFSDIEMAVSNLENGEKEESQIDITNNEKFVFSLEALNELKECKTVDEFRAYIEKLIEVGQYIKDTVSQSNENQLEIKKEENNNQRYVLKQEESTNFNLAKLRKNVLANIVGQDEAVYDLTRTIAINQTSKNYRNKSHILITGPSGTGKTEMVNVVAKELELPIFKANAPDYTKAGYYGKEVPTMLIGLLDAANGDLEKAQNGILVIDEVDKLVTYQNDKGFGKGVIHEMLKILDRDVIEVDIEKGRNNKMMFDTSNLTVILMGSFDELYEQKKQTKKNTIGFGTVEEKEAPKARLDEDDFIGWMGPEFIGRVGTIASTDELSYKTILKILKQSKLSQLKIAEQDLAERGIKLKVTSGYLNEIIKKGYSKKLGVRKLNKEVKKTLNCAYDEILTNPKIKTIKLTKKTVLNNKEYYVEY